MFCQSDRSADHGNPKLRYRGESRETYKDVALSTHRSHNKVDWPPSGD